MTDDTKPETRAAERALADAGFMPIAEYVRRRETLTEAPHARTTNHHPSKPTGRLPDDERNS